MRSSFILNGSPFYLGLAFSCILFLLPGCGSSSSNETQNAVARASMADIANEAIEVERQVDEALIRRLKADLIAYSKEHAARTEKKELYERFIQLPSEDGWGEDYYGTVYFHNGKVSAVSWHDVDLGINGTYTCYFNADGRLHHIESFNHNGREVTAIYSFQEGDDIVNFSHQGSFSESQQPFFEQASVDANFLGFKEVKDFSAVYMKGSNLANYAPELSRATSGTRYYKGTINGTYPVVANVILNERNIQGIYRYENSTANLDVLGNIEQNKFTLTETDPKTKEITGSFKGEINADGSLTGTWSNRGQTKKFSFEFTPSTTYTTSEGKQLAGLPILTPELGHQVIKTNYHDLPEPAQQAAKELLEVNALEELRAGGTAANRLLEFVTQSVFDNDLVDYETFDRRGSPQVIQYFSQVMLNLPNYVPSTERHQGYYEDLTNKAPAKTQLLSYLLYRIDRSPANIQHAWNLYKDDFFKLGDDDTFERLQVFETVDDLLNSYAQLEPALQAWDQVSASTEQPEIVAFESNREQRWSELFDADTKTYHRKAWAFSFWDRRRREGNHHVVAAILKEIKQ